MIRFISHPEVVIDPKVAVPDWGLSKRGRERLALLLEEPWIAEVAAVWSSRERKAIETAEPIAATRGLTVHTLHELHENDRSATGFLPPDEFDRRRRAGEFLECKEVFGRGDWYGTLHSQVAAGLAAGKWVILEIDVEGMRSVLERYPDTITIFIHCGGIDELERRLRARNTDSEDAINRRLEVARHELAWQNHYRYQILNDDVDESVRRICEILQQLGAPSNA